MKYLQKLGMLGIMAISFFSCEKTSDAPDPVPVVNPTPANVNWNEELKNSIWAGEYKYTEKNYRGLQPFSVRINGDGTLTWIDIENTRAAGVWKVEGSRINFTFPNGTTLSAALAKEKWSDFKSGAGAGFVIDNTFSSAQPDGAALENTTWAGTDGTRIFTIKFFPNNMILFIQDGSTFYTGAYTISSGGLQFTPKSGSSNLVNFFGVFKNGNNELSSIYHYVVPGSSMDVYVHWTAKKL